MPIADLRRRDERRVSGCWPPCTSGPRPARVGSSARRCSPGMIGVHAFQGTRWTVAGEVPGTGRRPPPGDRAVRPVRDRYGADPDRLRLGGPVAGAVHGARARPRATPASPTNPVRVAHRDELIALLEAHFATDPAEHWLALLDARRGPVGQGPHPRRRLRLGADPLPGPAAQRRAPHPGHVEPPRVSPALRRPEPLRRPRPSTSLRPRWASTTTRSATGSTPRTDAGQIHAAERSALCVAA